MNERLRTTMLRAGLSVGELAECAGVEAKTVERWISLDRVPHRQLGHYLNRTYPHVD